MGSHHRFACWACSYLDVEWYRLAIREPAMHRVTKSRKQNSSGFTLLELLISVGFLSVGLLAVGLLITTALASSNRNKLDSGGTLVAQRVMDTILATPTGTLPLPQIRDCNPGGATNFSIDYRGSAAGLGATIDNNTGYIDFSAQTNAGVAAGYKMLYVSCGAQGQQVTYDVRWRVQCFNAACTSDARQITVSARQIGATGSMKWASRPVTLRSVALN